jgi:8-oxo-dGTP diphosphatase
MIVAVTAGIVVRGNKVLVVQRKPSSPRGMLWEFPGGKVEKNENPRQSLTRELKEELGVEVAPVERFEIVYHPYEDVKVLLLSYLCRLVRGEPRALECHRIRWVTQRQLQELPMTEADIPLRNALCHSHSFPESSAWVSLSGH